MSVMLRGTTATIAVSIAVCLCLSTQLARAHKPVMSQYTYYEHIQPLFRVYCGGCHQPDGIAPMSLVSYQTAFPWAESIKEQLLADSLHPWHDDDQFGAYRPERRPTAFQLNQIIDWASGGTPEGKSAVDASLGDRGDHWSLGIPDDILEVPFTVTLNADCQDTTLTVLLPGNWAETRYLAAFDLKPGNPGLVHDAVVYVATGQHAGTETPPSDLSASQLLGTWIPGQTRSLGDLKSGYSIPRGSQIALRLHYRKSWQKEGVTLSDRSKLGLYFISGTPDRVVETTPLLLETPTTAGPQTVVMEAMITRDSELRSLFPAVSEEDATLEIVAIQPDGIYLNLVRVIGYDPGWPVRYDFHQPIFLPAGTRVKVVTNFMKEGIREEIRRVAVWMDYVEVRRGQ